MALTDFTTYNDIRAALGVTDEEIGDDVLSLSLYEQNLIAELEDISLDIISDYKDAKSDSARDEDTERFYQTTRLYSTYRVALHLTSSLPLFSPKDIADGKATMSRYADSPYKMVIEQVKQLADRYRKRLTNVYESYSAGTTPTTTARVYFGVSVPSTDQVTG